MKRAWLLPIAVVLGASLARAAEIRTVGEKLDDDVTSIGTEGGRTVLRTAHGKIVALEEVKHIRFDDRAPLLATDANVILLNKDEIHGTVGAWLEKGDSFVVRSASLGDVTVKIDNVAAIFFNEPPEAERRFTARNLGWLQKADFEGRPGPDAVYIRAGGKAPGTINEIAGTGIKLDAEGIGIQNFALKDIEAIICGKAGAAGAPPPARGTLVRIRCADGSSVSGSVTKFDGSKLELAHALGPIAIPSKELLELFVLNGAFVYLSDLEPLKVEESFPPGLKRDKDLYGWKRDKEVVEGGRLRLGGRSYDKGLGVHTYCALTYKLGGAYKEFRTVVGLDDSVKYWGQPGFNSGSATFRVLLGDDKRGMKPAKEIPEGKRMQRGDAPCELTINVEGVDTITLVADYGDYMHILGRADWADAHLVKR